MSRQSVRNQKHDVKQAASQAAQLVQQRQTCEGCAFLQSKPRPRCGEENSPHFRTARESYQDRCAQYAVTLRAKSKPADPEPPKAKPHRIATSGGRTPAQMIADANALLRKRQGSMTYRQFGQPIDESGWRAPAEFGLTRQEERFLGALVDQEGARSTDFLFDHISYCGSRDSKRLVTVIACRVRAKLKPFGLHVETTFKLGYWLEDDTRKRLLNWPAQQSAAA